MSSARSNAGARNRRAGGAETVPSTPQQNVRPGSSQQQQQQSQQQPQMNPRLSISDAIALITLRLGRVENLIQNMPVDSPSGFSSNLEQDENMRMVDASVFESMVNRLDILEKGHKYISDKQQQQQLQNQQQQMQHQQYQQQINSLKLSSITQTPIIQTPIIIDSKSEENIIKLTDNVDILKAEVVQVKDLLMKLQSFTMETNQKLSDIVFNDTGNLDECMDDNTECATIEHSEIQSADIQVQIPKGLNLKENVELAISEQKSASTENADVLSA